MKNWMFVVAMSNRSNEEIAGWIGVSEEEGEWKTGWYDRDPSNLNDPIPMGEGEVFYTGDSVGRAKEACLTLIHLKESSGLRLSFPIKLFKNESASGPSALTVLDFFSDVHCHPDCYEDLRKWRYQTAQERKIAPFIVATNRLLKQIAAFIPYNENEAMQLNGMGKNRWQLYGKDIIEITKKYDRNHSFPLNWVKESIAIDDYEIWREDQIRAKETRQLEMQEQAAQQQKIILKAMGEGNSLIAISEQINQSVPNVLKQIEKLREEGYDVLAWLEKEVQLVDNLSEIITAATELGTSYAKPVFQRLYPDVPNEEAWKKYDEIRTVFAYIRTVQLDKKEMKVS